MPLVFSGLEFEVIPASTTSAAVRTAGMRLAQARSEGGVEEWLQEVGEAIDGLQAAIRQSLASHSISAIVAASLLTKLTTAEQLYQAGVQAYNARDLTRALRAWRCAAAGEESGDPPGKSQQAVWPGPTLLCGGDEPWNTAISASQA